MQGIRRVEYLKIFSYEGSLGTEHVDMKLWTAFNPAETEASLLHDPNSFYVKFKKHNENIVLLLFFLQADWGVIPCDTHAGSQGSEESKTWLCCTKSSKHLLPHGCWKLLLYFYIFSFYKSHSLGWLRFSEVSLHNAAIDLDCWRKNWPHFFTLLLFFLLYYDSYFYQYLVFFFPSKLVLDQLFCVCVSTLSSADSVKNTSFLSSVTKCVPQDGGLWQSEKIMQSAGLQTVTNWHLIMNCMNGNGNI